LTIFNLGAEGTMTVLDLSTGLEKMMAFGDRLVDRLLVNARVPASLVGRVDSSDAPSGIAMLIDAAPFAEVIGTLRMTRDPKYSLLLEFAQRLAMTSGAIEAGPIPKTRVAFGSFLPMDRTTAVQLLIGAGFPIEDAKAEVEQAQREDVSRAKEIADATGNDADGARALGLEPREEPQPPEVTLPEPPPQPPV
jgi:hypothetical protein